MNHHRHRVDALKIGQPASQSPLPLRHPWSAKGLLRYASRYVSDTKLVPLATAALGLSL